MSVTVSQKVPSLPEATAARIRAASQRPPSEELTILDQLAVPRNLDDLVMQIQDAHDCNMFFPMRGIPRAYMEIPVWQGEYTDDGLGNRVPDIYWERWVYQVFGWWAKGSQAKTERLLCEAAWKDFVALRKQFAQLYGQASPLIVWRREPEIEQTGGRGKLGPVRTRINMRFAIPGIDLKLNPRCWDDRGYLDDSKYEIKPEPVV